MDQYEMLQALGMFTPDGCECGWPPAKHDPCKFCGHCPLLCQEHCDAWNAYYKGSD